MPSAPSDSPLENCTPNRFSGLWPRLVLAAILLLVTFIRLRVASSPLERDEGEYAFLGQLMLQGIPPYTEAANMKFPGTYAAYAIIEAVFGQTSEGIHHGLLVMNLATILLMYQLGKAFLKHRHTAVMAAAIYAITSLSYSFLGPMAHATHFVVFFGLAGLCLLFRALNRKSSTLITVAGFMTGLAYLAKQSGFYFVPFGCLLILADGNWRLFSSPTLRGLLYFIAGAFAPFALTVLIFQQLGCLDNFIFWTLNYAATYSHPLERVPHMLFGHLELIMKDGFAWMFFLTGAVFFLPRIRRATQLTPRTMALLALFFALSLIGVSLGLHFRNHYFIQALPAVALLSALFFVALAHAICRPGSRWAAPVASLLCLACCSAALFREAPRFFHTAPNNIIREVYGGNPFVESTAVANYIKEHSSAQDRIFVFGNEPQIYFYAQRHSASSYIYLYSLFERQPYAEKMQQQLIEDVTQRLPRYFIEAHIPIFPPDFEKTLPLYQWKSALLAKYYRPIFILDLNYPNDKMILGDAMKSYSSMTGCYMSVWEKNPD